MMHGLGQLAEACVVNPKQLDVGVWKVGGVMAALRLVELANSERALEKAVELLCDVIGQSWRSSEDAGEFRCAGGEPLELTPSALTERSQAYDILAHHLRAKASLITSTTHDTLLVFCGFDLETPGQSVVSNVLAVRHILLDFALWGATELQWAHLERLRELVQRSEHADFNLRRLSKMRESPFRRASTSAPS